MILNDKPTGKEYFYNPIKRKAPLFLGPALFLVLFIPFVARFIPILTEIEIREALVDISCLMFFPIYLVFIIIITMNTQPNVIVLEDGLAIDYFLIWWIFIPWKDIEGIRYSHPLFKFMKVHVIVVRQLTIWHRLLALTYYIFSKAVVVIKPSIQNYDELVALIEQKVAENNRST